MPLLIWRGNDLKIEQCMWVLLESSSTENATPIVDMIDLDCHMLWISSVCPSSPVVLHSITCFYPSEWPVLNMSVTAPTHLLLASVCVQNIGGKEEKLASC